AGVRRGRAWTSREAPPAAETAGAERPDSPPERPAVSTPATPLAESRARAPEKARDWAWADLMRRVFDLDVLVCPRCGGRMSVIGPHQGRDAVPKILPPPHLPTDV